MVTCFVGVGSNLGDKRKNINLAIRKLNTLDGVRVIKVSKLIETEPVGMTGRARKFLNAVIKIKTSLKPVSLLKKLEQIEQELGRPKRHARNASRTIDLDILFYADKTIQRKELQVPHPRIFEREFVLRPLLEVL